MKKMTVTFNGIKFRYLNDANQFLKAAIDKQYLKLTKIGFRVDAADALDAGYAKAYECFKNELLAYTQIEARKAGVDLRGNKLEAAVTEGFWFTYHNATVQAA